MQQSEIRQTPVGSKHRLDYPAGIRRLQKCHGRETGKMSYPSALHLKVKIPGNSKRQHTTNKESSDPQQLSPPHLYKLIWT